MHQESALYFPDGVSFFASFGLLQETVNAYLDECRKYGVTPNSGVLVALRFNLDVLRTTKPFHCKDLVPLAEVLIRLSDHTQHITKADFSLGMHFHTTDDACPWNKLIFGFRRFTLFCHPKHKTARIRSHGAIVLSKVLPHTGWESLELRHNPIGEPVTLHNKEKLHPIPYQGCF